MNYIFKGKLCAYLCGDCSEPLSNIKIRLYKITRVEDATLLAVANAKETFHQVNSEGLKAKSKLLLAETTADANGDFTFNLSDKEGYNGEAFDVDFVCGTGWGKPHPPKKTEEFQFHITTLQPQWREKQTNEQLVKFAGWEFCLSAKWWCSILKLIDRWVICGNIKDCETGVAAAGVRVFAYDVDLFQDDPLGDTYTDAYGHFRIVYTSADFSKTLLSWLNVEWPAGPDLYFRIESASGLVLLQEDRQTGHRQDRTNVHNCFCVDFCVKYPGEVLVPWFTHVGNYNISSDMDANGLTINNRSFASGVGFGFFGAVKLVGYASKKVPTDLTRPLYYRFMFSLDGSAWNPVTETQMYPYRLKVGVRQIIWNGTTAFQDIVIDPAQAASIPDSIPPDNFPLPIPDHVLRLDTAGWVRVDQRGLDSGFYGPLLWVNTNTIVPGGIATDAGDAPGSAPVNPKAGHKVLFAFQITDDPSNPASPHFREQAQEGIIHVNNWNEVSLLRLDELFAGGGTGCNPISTHANVHFTADHELMAEWELGVSSAAVPGGISVIAPGSSGNAPRGSHLNIDFATPGTVNPAFTPINWPSCAYRLTLTTRRRLTDGEYNDPGRNNEILFCR
ncbi:hypothetical protein A4D02_14355 [Niastella koreensis]|uniref:Carboxypeptidase regulatory-like domain-containing protein n=2 Tax=Niastella koreensis TaxID=354356 RepID=G8T9C3_NIAKG|nr:hypothetical protein [Niastella koreensis]AEV98091.1 hypothetical protein Niako_1728 [Niastella koreensis GR20-10]OQP40111.1 hypothetical protein A4D02_14355 [Niastella koreensis]